MGIRNTGLRTGRGCNGGRRGWSGSRGRRGRRGKELACVEGLTVEECVAILARGEEGGFSLAGEKRNIKKGSARGDGGCFTRSYVGEDSVLTRSAAGEAGESPLCSVGRGGDWGRCAGLRGGGQSGGGFGGEIWDCFAE